MNNEDKRFKQINRIATPIQVNKNENSNAEQPSIPPKQTSKKQTRKKLSKETILTIIIVFLSILCLGAFIFLIIIFIPSSKQTSLKYNDATKPTTSLEEPYYISSESLSEIEKIDIDDSYTLNNFIFTLKRNTTSLDILVNDKFITSANYLISNVGFVDDLVMFTTKNTDSRTTTFYIVDQSGNIVYEIYNYDDIDGMVLNDTNAVNYNSTVIVLSMARVNNNLIYNSNKLGNNTSADICNEDSLFQNSIETKKAVKINYSLEYLGNHKFSNPFIIYEESLSDYKANNNLCN